MFKDEVVAERLAIGIIQYSYHLKLTIKIINSYCCLYDLGSMEKINQKGGFENQSDTFLIEVFNSDILNTISIKNGAISYNWQTSELVPSAFC